MRHTLIVLTLAASPALAQFVPVNPLPTTPYVPVAPAPVYRDSITPASPTYTPQYVYRNYEGSSLTQTTPEFVIVPRTNGTTVYRALPDSRLYDITQPIYTIK
jgi:hypothetical protein